MKSIVGIALGTVVVIIVIAMVCSFIGPDWKEAEGHAKQFSKNISGARNVSCVKKDTDGDGWCSCTIFGDQIVPVDCGCERFCLTNCAEGCKISQPRMRSK